MYKIKDKYKTMIAKYSMDTKLDLDGVHDLKTWNDNGFQIKVLEHAYLDDSAGFQGNSKGDGLSGFRG